MYEKFGQKGQQFRELFSEFFYSANQMYLSLESENCLPWELAKYILLALHVCQSF